MQQTKVRSIDAVVVGGGQAGITTSNFLKENRIPHVVLERAWAFSEWYRRWDSFRMNTANWMNTLPGETVEFAPGKDRHEMGSRADAIQYFESYIQAVNPPILEGCEVTEVRQRDHGSWQVITNQGHYVTPNVVICTGNYQHPRIPPLAADLPASVRQLHSADYRNPEQIRSASVLVVGSGSSGVQICADLARSGRFTRITLAVSGNEVFPWKVLGVHLYSLMRLFRLLDLRTDSWLGQKLIRRQLEGRGDPTLPPSPAELSRRHGVELVGKVAAADHGRIRCEDGQVVDPADLTVVWCTGFSATYDFILPAHRDQVFDGKGQPIHKRGVVPAAPGLYFVGLRFQHTLTSQDIYGVGRDAAYIVEQLLDRVSGRKVDILSKTIVPP